MSGEVNLIVAHPLEAKALIEWFNLDEIRPRQRFGHYGDNKGIALAICGQGARGAADAVDWLRGHQPPGYRAWLNIGIAGHPSAPVGRGLLINRIKHLRTGECFWPPIPNIGLSGCGLITVDEPETVYPEDAAYDMEAAGFYAAAARRTTTDLVYVFKIVSDNRERPASELNPSQVPELFRQQERAIRELVEHLRGRSAACADWHHMPGEYGLLLRKYRFSAARGAELAKYCRRFRALGKQSRLRELARGRFRDAASLMTAMRLELASANKTGGISHSRW